MQGYTEPRPCSGLDLEQQHAQQTQRTQNITHQPPRSRRSHYPSIWDASPLEGKQQPWGEVKKASDKETWWEMGKCTFFSRNTPTTKRTRSSITQHFTVHCPLFNLESILSEQLSLFDHMREQSAHVSQPLVSSGKALPDRRVLLLQPSFSLMHLLEHERLWRVDKRFVCSRSPNLFLTEQVMNMEEAEESEWF